MDDASLQGFLDKAASNAGLAGIKFDPAFANIQRDYWSADSESFLHLGQKIAREVGGTFKIRGDWAVVAKRGSGLSPSGAALPPVMGVVGVNVICLDIEPISMRDRFKTSVVRYFDRPEAMFKTVEVGTDDERAKVDRESLTSAVDEAHAREIAEGRKSDSKREGGDGSAELDLDIDAQPEAQFILRGARPGVDGAYRIASVGHKVDRGGGSTTSLELKEPGQGAGSDDRAA